MEVNAVLCNHAEVQNNLLYLAGGGIDRTFVPQGSTGPWIVQIAIGITLRVPWTQTNQPHTLTMTLIDADDHQVELPTGPEETQPVRAELGFTLGRPPALQVG